MHEARSLQWQLIGVLIVNSPLRCIVVLFVSLVSYIMNDVMCLLY